MTDTRKARRKLSRRAWLTGSAAGVAGLAIGCESFEAFRGLDWTTTASQDATPSRPPVIDAHVHLFAADQARFPYHPDAPYVPDRHSPVEPFLDHLAAARIDGAVLVHPEPYQDDHRYTLHCLAVAGKRLRATCLFDPNSPETPEAMMKLCEQPGFVAMRIHCHREDRLPEFDSGLLREIWHTAAQLGLCLQLHGVPKHLARFARLIQDFPRTPVLIDHLGRPGQGTAEEIQGVFRLAGLSNVYMKFSGLAYASREPYPHTDIRPLLEGIVELFGPRRMLWGDSYSGKPYGQATHAVDDVLSFVDAPGRREIAGGTAARLFGFA